MSTPNLRQLPPSQLTHCNIDNLSWYPVSKRTLLIALTDWGQAQHKLRAAQAGFDEHLTKPVELDLLRLLMTVTEPADAAEQPAAHSG